MSNSSNTLRPSTIPPDRLAKASKATRMEQAIRALLQGSTLEQAAQAARVHASTLRRWWKLPEFQGRYAAARQEVSLHTKGRLLQGSQAAIGTLFRIMTDQSVAPGTRLQAAKYVVDKSEERAQRAETRSQPEGAGSVNLAQRLLAARQRRLARLRNSGTKEGESPE